MTDEVDNAAPVRKKLARQFLAAALITAVGTSGLAVWLDPLTIDWSFHHLPIRMGAAVALIAVTAWFWTRGANWFRKRLLTDWWDPADRPDGELNWDMVLRLTTGRDPLTPTPVVRNANFLFPAIAIGGAVSLASCVILVAARFILEPHVPGLLIRSGGQVATPGDAANLSGNLTAMLAIIAASVSIVFTYHQLQAKVRADNRQAWIARLRRLIAQVTALSFELAEVEDRNNAGHRAAKIWKRLGAKRFEFELMLNPHEKDHRLLIYLVQRLGSITTPVESYIKDAADLRKDIGELSPQWLKVLDCDRKDELTGYIMRLSHIVLKREWERVKRTR